MPIPRKNRQGKVVSFEARVKVQGVRLTKCFPTYRQALAWENEKKYLRNSGTKLLDKPVTVRMLFESYISWAKAKGRAAATLAKAETYFEKYLKAFYGEADMRTVTVEQHEAFIHKMMEALSAASANRIRSLISVMYNVAIRKRKFDGTIKENPMSFIEKIEELRPEINCWETGEVLAFLQKNRDSFYYSMWVMFLNTGLRVGELVAASREQFHLESHIMDVNCTWDHNSGVMKNKTKNGRRKVGLNEAVQQEVYPVVQGKSGLIFTDESGKMLNNDRIGRGILVRACKRAGVKPITIHGLRHTFATQYLASGGEIANLSEILGHSTVQLTKDYYIHFSPAHRRKISNVMSVTGNLIEVDFGKEKDVVCS